jgi:hypothetical protein
MPNIAEGSEPTPKDRRMRFDHVGIPTRHRFDGEIPLPHLKMIVSDHLDNPFGIQWQRYWDDAPYPDLVKTVPHVGPVGRFANTCRSHRRSCWR